MSVKQASVHAKWIVGKVIGTKMAKTAKVRVTRLVLDPYLLKYFNKRKTYFAHDPEQQCTVGDIVLLKALPEMISKRVKHELAEMVYKVGRVVDPVTGKPCAGEQYLESLTDSDTKLSDKMQDLKISPAQNQDGADEASVLSKTNKQSLLHKASGYEKLHYSANNKCTTMPRLYMWILFALQKYVHTHINWSITCSGAQ